MDIILKCLLVAIMLAAVITVTGCSSNQKMSDPATMETQTQQSVQNDSQVQSGFTDVSAAQAKQLIDSDKDLQIIDVREQYEFDSGHMPNAELIPVGQLESRINEIDKTKPVLLYCATGARSRGAAQYLSQAGFSKVFNLRPGIVGWNYDIVK